MGCSEKPDLELMSLICPKCGYEQEERLDCLKCGIVFSKFYTIHPSDKPVRPEAAEPSQTVHLAPEDNFSFDLAEMRQQVKELHRRLNEVEFERAERGQIRAELRNLERRFQSGIEELTSRFDTLEKLTNEPPAPPPVPAQQDYSQLKNDLYETLLLPLAQRVNQVEDRLEKISGERAPLTDPLVLEALAKLDQRVVHLETRLSGIVAEQASKDPSAALLNLEQSIQSLRTEVDALSRALDLAGSTGEQLSDLQSQRDIMQGKIASLEESVERLSNAPADKQPNEPIEADIHSIRESLDQIRQFIIRLDLKSEAAVMDFRRTRIENQSSA